MPAPLDPERARARTPNDSHPPVGAVASALPVFGALLSVLLPTACGSSLDVPGETRINCASTAECPSGFECSPALGRCVARGGDAQPPEVVAGTLTLSAVLFSAPETIEVSFTVSETLAASPIVELRLDTPGGEERLPLAEVSHDPDTLLYTFAVGTTGDEPESDADLSISLIDPAGNPGGVSVPGALRLDFSAPRILGASFAITTTGLAAPPAATVGSLVTVSLTLDEPLTDLSVLASDVADPNSVLFDLVSTVGLVYTFESLLGAGPFIDGPVDIQLIAFDAAGNSDNPLAVTLPIDSTAPAPPAVDSPGVVLLHRNPWGTASAAAGMTLSAGVGALGTDEVLELWAGTDPTSLRLGAAREAGGGAAGDITLPGVDLADVWVSAQDPSGNRSTRVRVLDGRWTASLVGKTGALSQNPHRVATSARFPDGPYDPLSVELLPSQYARLAQPSEPTNASVSGTARAHWRPIQSIPELFRIGAAAAFDADQTALVVFGGLSEALGIASDTWELRDDAWAPVGGTGNRPEARVGATLSLLPDGTLFLFGGGSLDTFYATPWILRDGQWQELGEATGPSARGMHAAAWDPGIERLVVYGGCPDAPCESNYDNRTWLYNPSSGTWESLDDINNPGPRQGHAMTYDPGRGGIVLHGGCIDDGFFQCFSGEQSADTWLFTGGAWQTLGSVGAGPGNRYAHSLVYDDSEGRLLLFGGRSGSPAVNTLWGLSATGVWTAVELSPPTSLQARSYHAAAFDSARGRMLIFGGSPSNDLLGDTWQFVDGTWTPVQSNGARPEPRGEAAAAFSTGLGLMVPFGASDACLDATNLCEDAWSWNPEGWQPVDVTPGPAAVSGAAVAADQTGQVYIVGGDTGGGALTDDLWIWDPAPSPTWTLCSEAGIGLCNTRPTARSHGAAAWAAPYGLLYFGGHTGSTFPSELWLYSNVDPAGPLVAGWNARCSPSTTACPMIGRQYHTMAYDSARDRLVLFGGRAQVSGTCGIPGSPKCSDTWEWNGAANTWSERCLVDCTPPLASVGVGMDYDPALGRTLAFGGETPGDSIGTSILMQWDGARWTFVPSVGPQPPDRLLGTLTYDSDRGRMLAFGGGRFGGFHNDLWELRPLYEGRPAILAAFAWSAAEVPTAQVSRIDIAARAGGVGASLDNTLGGDADVLGEPLPGVELLVWHAGRWHLLADDSDAPGSPNAAVSLDGSITDGSLAQAALLRRDETLHIALRPSASTGNGAERATVALDYLETTVHYRRLP